MKEQVLKETVQRGHLVIARHLAEEHDDNAFNAAMAKMMKKLKKDVPGVKSVHQSYKGTGSKKHRRQMWVDFENKDRKIDVWLDTGKIKFGGIRFTGKHVVDTAGRDVAEVYREVVSFLKKHAVEESIQETVQRGHLTITRKLDEVSSANPLQHVESYMSEAMRGHSIMMDNLNSALNAMTEYLHRYGPDQNLSAQVKYLVRIFKEVKKDGHRELAHTKQLVQKIRRTGGEYGPEART